MQADHDIRRTIHDFVGSLAFMPNEPMNQYNNDGFNQLNATLARNVSFRFFNHLETCKISTLQYNQSSSKSTAYDRNTNQSPYYTTCLSVELEQISGPSDIGHRRKSKTVFIRIGALSRIEATLDFLRK